MRPFADRVPRFGTLAEPRSTIAVTWFAQRGEPRCTAAFSGRATASRVPNSSTGRGRSRAARQQSRESGTQAEPQALPRAFSCSRCGSLACSWAAIFRIPGRSWRRRAAAHPTCRTRTPSTNVRAADRSVLRDVPSARSSVHQRPRARKTPGFRPGLRLHFTSHESRFASRAQLKSLKFLNVSPRTLLIPSSFMRRSN